MASQGTGTGSSSDNFGAGFDAMAKQFWNTWAGAMQGAQPTAPGMGMGMADAMNWWSRMMPGRQTPPGISEMFTAQGHFWQAQMRRLAEQFAGSNPSAQDVTQAWKQLLGENPFAGLGAGTQVPGQFDIAQWMSQVMPWLSRWQSEGKQWLDLPTFGFAREHQERWQHLAQAQMDHQQHAQAYQTLLGQAAQDAFRAFETKLAARGESGQPIATARGLFDVWIDAAEEAYADLALSPRFREAYGHFVNSQMRLRGALHGEVERLSESFGIPGRTEVDAAHRKIAQLERELRRLRDDVVRLSETHARTESAPNSPSPASPPTATETGGAVPVVRAKPVTAAATAAVAKPAAKSVAAPTVSVAKKPSKSPAKSVAPTAAKPGKARRS